MDNTKVSAKDFFLWIGAMVALYWSVVAGILLIFDYINYVFPNPLAYYPVNPYEGGISYEMASIIVMLPISMFLMWLIRRDAASDPSRNELWIRRWIIILTLFVSGATIAGDLITLLTTFLSGQELTTAFLLKVLVVFLIAAAVFLHFIAELRGYWRAYPARRRMVTIGTGVVAVAVIVAGFIIVGTPGQARLMNFDSRKTNDLASIQLRITTYWQAKQKLPASLSELENAVTFGEPLPMDPQTGKPYVYQATGPLTFKLCADFNTASRPNQYLPGRSVPVMPDSKQYAADNWQHGAGNVCFDRTIDPSYYPPLKGQM